MTEAERQARYLEDWFEQRNTGVYGAQWMPAEAVGLAPVRKAISEIPEGSRIMEIGPGGGRWTRYLLARWPASLTLVDGTAAAFPHLVGLACECEEVRCIVSRQGSLAGVANNSVDVVFSFDVFVHFDEGLRRPYVEEVARVLAPGGTAVLHWAVEHGARINAFCYVAPPEERWYEDMIGELLWAHDWVQGGGSRMGVFRKE